MAMAHRWASRNLSRLELAAAVIILGIVATSFMGFALRVLAAAEEQYVQATVLNIASALRIQFYRFVIEGRSHEVMSWRDANPVALIEEWGAPADIDAAARHPALARYGATAAGLGSRYLGEFDGLDPGSVAGGRWYFERFDSALVYRVRNAEFFRSALPGAARIRYRIDVRFDDRNGDGEYNSGTDEVRDVVLVPLEAFRWIEAGEAR